MGRIGTERMYKKTAFLSMVCDILEQYLKPILYKADTIYADQAAKLYQDAFEVLWEIAIDSCSENSGWLLDTKTNKDEHKAIERGCWMPNGVAELFYEIRAKNFSFKASCLISYINLNGVRYGNLQQARFYRRPMVIYNTKNVRLRDWTDSDYLKIDNNISSMEIQISSTGQVLMYFFPDSGNIWTGGNLNAWIYTSLCHVESSMICGNLSRGTRKQKGIHCRFPEIEKPQISIAEREFQDTLFRMAMDKLDAKFTKNENQVMSQKKNPTLWKRVVRWFENMGKS